jgi:hypothetical protein
MREEEEREMLNSDVHLGSCFGAIELNEVGFMRSLF